MIYRIDVRPRDADADPLGQSIATQVREFGADVAHVTTARIFLIDADATHEQIQRAAVELLADPIVERAEVLTDAHSSVPAINGSLIEVHLKPGVMDPVAASTEMALREMGIDAREVRTGRAYHLSGVRDRVTLEAVARRVLANDVIESVHFEPYFPRAFPAAQQHEFQLRRVPLRDLNDDQLKKLSRDGHLFLSIAEMRAIQSHYKEQGREPTDVELETIAQTWSEHCVHKTLKSPVDLEVRDAGGKLVETRHYDNLIRDTIFRSTTELNRPEFCLSIFKDNAGVIAFDETDAVCFKVETHNHPSAIEPYGGAATGIGGCIRDVMGTGLGAKPIANTDVFCVALSEHRSLPRGVIHPKRVLQQVVAGVRDYGNRMGIPTVNGAVYFDDRYIGNPLVFAGCVGLIPRDRIKKKPRRGDAIVLVGGRTGRDGIHGATFSSAELTDAHADEFSHAVQIGNAITQKKMLDVILQARDRSLFTAITDCGAGGLSSAVGEMGEKLGATVELDRVPLKYAGLRYDEIWISEAQERMVLSVPLEHVDALLKLARGENVEATVIGSFATDERQLILRYRGEQVGCLSMQFLHHGLPMPLRKAVFTRKLSAPSSSARGATKEMLLKKLADPNIASKHWIIRQYDHEVQGGSVIKPLTGPLQIGPSDAAVIRPKLDSFKGVAIACGLAPQIEDPYDMALASIDEAIRNAVCVGADPDKLAILDNFCWPSCDDEETIGSLVRACEACRDAALAYGVPFISGKDSLNNQFTDTETGRVIRIPRTLLISAIGVIDDVRKCVTMDLKDPRDGMLCIGSTQTGAPLDQLARAHRAVAELVRGGHVLSAHDVSDGGWLIAAAEMCIASGLGLDLGASTKDAFDNRNGSYLLEIHAQGVADVESQLARAGVEFRILGRVRSVPATLEIGTITATRSKQVECHVFVEELTRAWRGTLDW